MRRDPTQFRERFKRWKEGKDVYEAGLPKYDDGTEPNLYRRPNGEYFYTDGSYETPVTPLNKLGDDPSMWTYRDASGKIYQPRIDAANTEVISQDNNAWTKQRTEEETNRRTWLSDAADIAHGAGEGAMVASDFVPFAGELFTGGKALLNNAKSLVGSATLYGRKFLLSQMMRPLNKNMPSVAARFRNQEELYLTPRKTSTPTLISWSDAQKPLSAQQVFPNETGKGWLKATADRLGINVNHYYNNIITPEQLMQTVKNNGYETFVSGKTFTEPAYIPSGFPYGLDKSKILMPYDAIRKMPMMAKYANLPEVEFRKIADDLIGSHEFIHWWNRQLVKNIKSGRMKTPKGYLEYELTWNGENLPYGIDPDALGKTSGYMSEMNGTESNARLGQLFNAFGIKKGELQPQHINLALKFYRKVFPDNQMSTFLNAIKDKDAFIKFANRNAGTLFGTDIGLVGYGLHNKNK